jgi:hypothetical protein
MSYLHKLDYLSLYRNPLLTSIPSEITRLDLKKIEVDPQLFPSLPLAMQRKIKEMEEHKK